MIAIDFYDWFFLNHHSQSSFWPVLCTMAGRVFQQLILFFFIPLYLLWMIIMKSSSPYGQSFFYQVVVKILPFCLLNISCNPFLFWRCVFIYQKDNENCPKNCFGTLTLNCMGVHFQTTTETHCWLVVRFPNFVFLLFCSSLKHRVHIKPIITRLILLQHLTD